MRRGALAWALLPLTLVFAGLSGLRRLAYRAGLLQRERLPVPVIVVGNVTAGGSGKTPLAAALVDHLTKAGLRVGIISRGYGRETRDCREVRFGSDPRQVGDEPLLLARTCGVPVFVARRRAEAGRALLQAHPGVQVIVCDDGLQHLALERDIEICVFDDRGVGNGWLLPSGPLREPWPRRVDFVLRTPGARGITGFELRRDLARHAVASDGSTVLLDLLKDAPIAAVAGIANPAAFFDMLRAAGIEPRMTLALPDHHAFAQPLPVENMQIVCTEKDASKLWRLHPDALAVPLHIEIAQPFWDSFDRLLAAKLSSADGSQTA